MPSKPISNTKRNMIKKLKPRSLNKLNTCTYCNQKQITKGATPPLQIFSGLDHILLRSYYRTISYAKLAPLRRKILHRMRLDQFTPRQPIPDIPVTLCEWQSDPGLLINMMIYTPVHGSVNMTSQYLIAITIIW